MVEEAAGLLKFVEVGDHFDGGAVEVFGVFGGAVGLEFDAGDHEHVINPVAGLPGEAGGGVSAAVSGGGEVVGGVDLEVVGGELGIELGVGVGFAGGEVFGFVGDEVHLEGDDGADFGIFAYGFEHAGVGGAGLADLGGVVGDDGVKLGFVADGVVEAECAVGDAGFGVDDGGGAVVATVFFGG